MSETEQRMLRDTAVCRLERDRRDRQMGADGLRAQRDTAGGVRKIGEAITRIPA